MFFEQYFKNRGENIEPNHNHEVQVRCPFPHDKGFEENASASFNIKRRIYKCFACTAEDRDSGMSETSFIAKLFHTTYDNAIKLKKLIQDTGDWSVLTSNLLGNKELMGYLHQRGLTDATIVQYKLGFMGTGIIYPVFMNNLLFDKRTYNKDHAPDEPKIKSDSGAKPLLFPYDEWIVDPKPTILNAGENDTLLGRQNGFNCVTTTLGEGSVPKLIINVFKGKTVYVCYDCDEAGRKSAMRIAYYLREAGATVYIIDLGLAGTKEDKDLSDYFLVHKKTPVDFQALIDNAPIFTQEQYAEQKNKEHELVDLWNVKQSRYSDKYISSRVMQMGHFEIPLVDVPSHIEWQCMGELESSNVCSMCPRRIKNNEGEWSLDSENLEDLLELVDMNKETQFKGMRRVCGIPAKCPNSRMSVKAKKHVEKVLLNPDVETESEESGYRAAELHAYIIDGDTEDGNRYRMYFKRMPSPKDGSLVMVVDKVENSDNAINSFKVTPQFIESMRQWQGHPKEIMTKRWNELGKTAVGKYLPEMVFYAADITYHGLLDMRFMGRYMKGHPEGLMVGASRTGKSEVLKALNIFYGLGNYTEMKNASTAGIIGGVDKSSNGTFRISWGSIPRNHRGLLFLDEISGIHPDVFKHLTGIRSERVAVIEKIQKGKAPAKTRLLWVGNPRPSESGISKSLYDYNYGVDICLDLFPEDQDIARFDFIVLQPEPAEYISPLNEDGTVPEIPQLPTELRDLIRWVWSRNQNQVKFEQYVEQYIEHTAINLNKDFGSSVKIIGIEGTKKIARIAASVAACCFSTDSTGETVIVRKEHVDWTRDFLVRCYDNDIFRLKEYVGNERKFSTTTDEINLEVAKLVKKYPVLIKLLLEQDSVPTYVLQSVSGIDKQEFNHVIHTMYQLGCLTAVKGGNYSSTRRLKLAIAAIKNKPQKVVVDPDKPKSFSDKINLQ